jgi:hypothetical protein
MRVASRQPASDATRKPARVAGHAEMGLPAILKARTRRCLVPLWSRRSGARSSFRRSSRWARLRRCRPTRRRTHPQRKAPRGRGSSRGVDRKTSGRAVADIDLVCALLLLHVVARCENRYRRPSRETLSARSPPTIHRRPLGQHPTEVEVELDLRRVSRLEPGSIVEEVVVLVIRTRADTRLTKRALDSRWGR